MLQILVSHRYKVMTTICLPEVYPTQFLVQEKRSIDWRYANLGYDSADRTENVTAPCFLDKTHLAYLRVISPPYASSGIRSKQFFFFLALVNAIATKKKGISDN
ncbi:hypothetical protein Ddye_029377 [Dipteronia dyeriana]|uniref:Uncharacterized protein n=1 Tax=Dipteronia dyeriana TaxID=168575 RepID=A0AAD9TFK8_9ROSI|nr:hypothetical protein Ddye_029377 [Dipteronia dyeriana]